MTDQELEPQQQETVEIEETTQEATDEHNQAEAQAAPDPKEENFRILRKSSEEKDRRLREAQRRIQELEAQKEKESQLDPDDLVEGKHLQKEVANLRAEIVATKIKSQYNDFDKVVSTDNLERLAESYPELARSMNDTQDFYSKAVSAYTLIKQFGIYKDEAPYVAQKDAIKNNSSKPRPVTSISPQQGESPLTRANAFANGLTDDLKADLIREMNDARKGY